VALKIDLKKVFILGRYVDLRLRDKKFWDYLSPVLQDVGSNVKGCTEKFHEWGEPIGVSR
jgi:hypothetical protein